MSLSSLIKSTQHWHLRFSIKGKGDRVERDPGGPCLSPEQTLQFLEAGGSSPGDLALALMDHFHVQFPEFRGLSCGFRRREQLSPRNPQMGIWALVVFRDGWRVLDQLGTTPEDLLRYLLGTWPPSAWMEEVDLLRIPSELRGHLFPDRLRFGPQNHPLDLHWLGEHLACGLTIMGPLPRLSLPQVLACAGDIHLENVRELRSVQNLTAPGKQITLKACPELERIELPESTAIVVQDCNRLTQVRGRVTGDLSVEDCSELSDLDVVFPRDALPPPSVIVKRCLQLESIGRPSGVPRVCRDVIVEDCPKFRGFGPRLIVRRERCITGCPQMMGNQ